jgi:hypothetical protein
MREGISGVIDADSCKGYTQQREGGRRMVRILFYHFSRASMTFVLYVTRGIMTTWHTFR